MMKLWPVVRACTAALLLSALTAAPAPVFAQDTTGPGHLGWCELLTHDAAAAIPFYEELFGWTITQESEGKFRVEHAGQRIAGITHILRKASDIDEGTWLVGLTVEDAGASVAAVRELGGKVFVGVSSTTSGGEFAIVEDAQGAQFVMFSGGQRIEGERTAGRWVWTELWTTDLDAARRFYAGVVGWSMATVDHPNGEYPVFRGDDENRAGVVPITGEYVEPGWVPYVGVDDLAKTLDRVRDLGGQVLLEPDPEIHDGRVAVLADPSGVGFMIVQLEEEGR